MDKKELNKIKNKRKEFPIRLVAQITPDQKNIIDKESRGNISEFVRNWINELSKQETFNFK